MKILITAATPFEITELQTFLQESFISAGQDHYVKGELDIVCLVTGVGLPLTSYHLGRILPYQQFDLALNVGVCGAFNKDLQIGEVVEVISEFFGDLGVENKDGSFTDLHEMELVGKNDFPFQNGRLQNPDAGEHSFLPKVKGTSVNKVHGSKESIDRFAQKYEVEVESMEGAAFFYACLVEKIPFVEIRSVSNYVEARNKENWDLPLAIKNLNKTIVELLRTLQEN